MTDARGKKSKADEERAARLAEALRANLKRRKDQQRGQSSSGEAHEQSGGGDSPSPPPSDAG